MAGDAFTRDLFSWLNQVKADAELPASAFKVAFEITQHVNRGTGEAWPSCRTIADGIGMSEGTVLSMVERLRSRGYLAVEPGCQGRGHSNRYRLTKPQRAEQLSAAENLSGLSNSTARKPQPAKIKPQPAEENHLKEPSEEPSEEDISATVDLFGAAEEPPPAHPRNTNGTGRTKSKPKPRIRDKAIADSFATWWQQYPRHVAKIAAFKAYATILRNAEATPDELLAGCLRYAAERAGEDPEFTKHPSTWLRAGCWSDESAVLGDGQGVVIDQAGNVINTNNPTVGTAGRAAERMIARKAQAGE